MNITRIKTFFREIFYKTEGKKFKLSNDFLALITVISVITIALETMPSFHQYSYFFYIIEIISTSIFTFEYLGRIIGTKHPKSYIFSFFGFIDLIAILPTLLGIGNLTFLKAARLLRVLRFLRIIKMVKVVEYHKSKSQNNPITEENVFAKINFEIYIVALIISLFFSAISMWYAEGYREVFISIPDTMIWSLKVLLGGVSQAMPETFWGEIIAIITRFLGLILFALLINIVAKYSKKFLLNEK